MNVLRFHRFYMAPLGEEGGGGGAAEPVAEAVAQVETPPVAEAKPATMREAMFPTTPAAEDAPADAGQPRDALGRWTPKTDATGAVIPGQVQPPNTTLVEPKPKEVDPLKMPEGLTPPAQQRFQTLANTNRELTAERDEARRQTEYIRDTFQKSGVKQDQFEQAVGVIGMINRGDFAGAQRVLEQQLQQLALMTGHATAQVDALASFPDLRKAVDQMQITEQHAVEIARSRQQAHQQQATQQRTQQQEQSQQQEQQAVDAGIKAVDDFCKQQAASDLDWPVVEAQLSPVINDLLQGVPPHLWANKVKAQVALIKATATRFKPATASTNVLRPTGQASPAATPKSAFEAMWGKPKPAIA